MVAFEVLSKIYQQHRDELTGSAASTFPQVDPATLVWAQRNRNVLVRDWDELTDSATSTFPQVDPSTVVWAQRNHNALIRD